MKGETSADLAADLAAVDGLANAALSLRQLPAESRAERGNVSENVTYLAQCSVGKAILRAHRAGNHCDRAIECELAWSAALRRETAIRTPARSMGRNGAAIQVMPHGDLARRRMVVFDFAAAISLIEDNP